MNSAMRIEKQKSSRLPFIVLLLLLIGCVAAPSLASAGKIIPAPACVEERPGAFTATDNIRIIADEAVMGEAELLAEGLKRNFASVEVSAAGQTAGEPGCISLRLSQAPSVTELGAEGGELEVGKDAIVIRSSDPRGVFYECQTLLQLLPEDKSKSGSGFSVPCTYIRDAPLYPYRGMLLDVSRHFFPKEFIEKYIDLLAMYKMNTFHWHLTDDQGWRIEIKKYPRLTSVGAYRKETLAGHASEQPPRFDGKPYGGFYTQDEVREIIAYASARHVTIIPEIEMPGHSQAALAAYPELSCTGGPFETASTWNASHDIYCAGNEQTFEFLENVLSEVIDLFPSVRIHVGGDEVPKDRWKVCPRCQARIKAEGLKDEEELQAYFVRRIQKFLDSRGRMLVGWDGVLEGGGVGPGAVITAWRGSQSGIAAIRSGHDVVMTPMSYCYFDLYQADPRTEPLAAGGLLTLKKVYSFDPAPPGLTGKERAHILGGQGNLWTEYVPTPEHAEYMLLPRMAALAEVLWTPESRRNWDDFLSRLQSHFKRLESMGVSFSRGSFAVAISTTRGKINGDVDAVLSSEQLHPEIRYTLDGSDPTASSPPYDGPIPLQGATDIKARIFDQGRPMGAPAHGRIVPHRAVGKPILLTHPYSKDYAAGGPGALTDGLVGSIESGDYWQGFQGSDIEAVIDLKEKQAVTKASMRFLCNASALILPPKTVTWSISNDGKTFKTVSVDTPNPASESGKTEIVAVSCQFKGPKFRWLKVRAQNPFEPAAGGEQVGYRPFLFADEIVVE